MKLHFEKPLPPNFIRTKEGIFPVNKLSEEELQEYIEIWIIELRKKHAKPIKND